LADDSGNVRAVAIALLTPYLAGYRDPLYRRLAETHGLEVLCYGGGDRYAPSWIAGDLDAKLAAAQYPARRLDGGPRAAFATARRYRAVIAPYAGGAILPAAYAGARAARRPFVLWASVWARPRSPRNTLALPLTNHIYRHADAVVAYGEHVRRFVAGIRGRDDDVFVAPQSVEPGLFGAEVTPMQRAAFRRAHQLPPDGPLVLYAGRLVPEKGVDVLLDAWPAVATTATLVLAGEGPLATRALHARGVRLTGPIAREQLPAAYAASELLVLPSVPTPRFREPWGLVCNEAMLQQRPVLATTAVGAAAGGLVRDGETGLVVPPGDPPRLAQAIDRLLGDARLRAKLGRAGRLAVAGYSYDAMAAGFDRALGVALSANRGGPWRSRSGRRRVDRGSGGGPPPAAG
jgi:glycosyltransferase involved in cell wall biosynthesis